jgi:peptide/nickel transport system ATP-binding protein
MTDQILKIQNLHVYFETYGETGEVIDGINFTIDKGETVGLVGETGCGKSVTTKAVLGLLPDNASIPNGEIRFKGENVLDLSSEERHRKLGTEMTMIMQDPMTARNPVFTVGEQMMDVLKWQGRPRLPLWDWVRDKFRSGRSEELRERAIDMLDEVRISDPERVYNSYPTELSGGMRQRIIIAMALLSEPDLLVADEPGTALDVTTEKQILGLLDDLASEQDMSVLYITHDLGVAKNVTDRVNVMYAGKVVESTYTDELFESPLHPYTKRLLDSIPTLSSDIGGGIGGGIPDYTDPPAGCRCADRCSQADEEGHGVDPYSRAVETEHAVACHLYQGPPAWEEESADVQHVDIGPAPWQRDVTQPGQKEET